MLEEYIQTVSSQIRIAGIRPYIVRELKDHIQDEQEAIMAAGQMSEEDAMRLAIKQMGDPVEVGEQLNQIHRRSFPWRESVAVVLLLVSTVPVVAALSSLTADISGVDAMRQQIMNIIVMLAVAFLCCTIDYSRLVKAVELPAVILVAVIYVAAYQNIYGFARIGGRAFSAAALSPMLIPVTACILYKARKRRCLQLVEAIIIMILSVAGLFCIDAPSSAVMLIAGGLLVAVYRIIYCHVEVQNRKWPLIAAVGLIIVLMVLALIAMGHTASAVELQNHEQLARAWNESVWVGGSITAQKILQQGTLNTMSDGSLIGIGALYGKLVSILIALALLMVALFILCYAARESNLLAGMLMFSCGCSILLQLITAIVSCVISITTFGAGLPLYSYGGTGSLVNGILIGLVLSVQNWRRIAPYETIMCRY